MLTRLPEIENAFHALAIDEARGNFPPTLWYLDSGCYKGDKPLVNLKQVWFPGYHSDVGGHSKGSIDTNSIDEIAFSWMCDQLVGLLQLSATVLQKCILFRLGDYNLITQGKDKDIKNQDAHWRKVEWNNGVINDNNGWLDPWWVTSVISTRKASYKRVPGETKAYEDKAKKIPINYKNFNEEIHPCVRHRVDGATEQKYHPAPFRDGWKYVAPTKTTRGHWKKGSGDKEVVLYEYTIPEPAPFHAGIGIEHWQGSLERAFAPKAVLAAQAPFVTKPATGN